MENRTLNNPPAATTNSTSSVRPREGRSVWVLTAYGFAGLALFGVLVYFFSSYVTQ